MSLTRQDVEKIAHLARLSITDQEMPVYVTSLSSIVNFVDELSRVETANVEPMAHPLDGQHQRLRAGCGDGERPSREIPGQRAAGASGAVRRPASHRVAASIESTTMLHNLSIGELADRLCRQGDFERRTHAAFPGADRALEPGLERA